ncbi:phosphoribosylformylglycinamidine synthase subunit II [Abditibacterium utsteinense]|uniref:Phosphoribosylformylglycinamidine synthase subunit PurL n=1 Tax=Abditibacterium utsteinense TaxID=1960156 RepID=A0A2S8SQ16_9BACT|nr:phosphoribosylformylglycinamidine synthase subunit PurL [Abditibacterium utsteinense]PQV62888.1 phosphoribosylformylglycinamidine synthase subunit II [Abditibacterium utsteinense]
MLEKALALGMTEAEYHQVVKILDRVPSATELAMYSVEWSEHCGYPRSRALLKLLPKNGHYASVAGADTGGIEVEPGLYVVFKMESHNHPSQVEPRQGAATGIGGIIRDIFTVGARPIANLNSLRFGMLDDPEHGAKARYLLQGVVDGISFYGNCMGIPTVGGEVGFNPSYRGNCLVGAMSVGVVKADEIASSAAAGIGNTVMYFGNATGRDGIGGCSVLASHEMTDLAQRPTVQVGDPFSEKCLLEATLEALKSDAIISMKDMGAAGLTCTTCEQAASGGETIGMDINLDKVPLREADMEAFEIMMSESQERMLGVVAKGREAEIIQIFEKWNTHAVPIGVVTDDGLITVRRHGEIVAQMSAQSLVESPLYHLPSEEPAYFAQKQGFDFGQIAQPESYGQVLLNLLQAPNIASKEWIYEQYDHLVQINTVVRPGAGDAAVLRLRDSKTGKGLAVKADCNSRYVYLDPFQGAQIAIAECARNLICVGAEPAGVTDCLCFGNPEKPDRFWQFKRAIEGITHACTHFRLPVVSGNVSLYNETPETVIHPSPLIGMVGVLQNVEQAMEMRFRDTGDLIILVGDCKDELGGSEYLFVEHGLEEGAPPSLDLQRELNVQRLTLAAIRRGLVKSAHDVSDGGLAVALAESCIAGRIGASIELPDSVESVSNTRLDSLLFGESQSRIVLSCAPQNLSRLQDMARIAGVPLSFLGTVGGEKLTISDNRIEALTFLCEFPVSEMESAFRGAIGRLMNQ